MVFGKLGFERQTRAASLLLAGLIFGLLLGQKPLTQLVAQQSPSLTAPTGGLQVVMSGDPEKSQWVTIVNPSSQALAIYRFEPNNPRGALKLEAVRQFRWDLMLSEYQNQPPEVSSVESMLRGKR
jgi:predicted membrane metal-binding protein